MFKKIGKLFMPKFRKKTLAAAGLFVLLGVGIFLWISMNNMGFVVLALVFGFVAAVYLWLTEKNKFETAEKERIIREREKEIERLKRENSIMAGTAFNVGDLRRTLELAVFEASTRIYRIMDENSEDKEREVRFFGALRLEITAKYGINFREMICSVGPEKTLYLENMEPRFLSFSSRSAHWDISEALEKKRGIISRIKGRRWKVRSGNAAELEKRKETFRQKLEKEIEQKGPMELNFLAPIMKEKVKNALGIILGHYGFTVKSGLPKEGSHVPLEAFLEQPGKYIEEK